MPKRASIAASAVNEENKTTNEQPVNDTAGNKPVKKIVVKTRKFDPHELVTVYNGFAGKLIYISKRTNEKWVWDRMWAEQDIELQELKNAKNSYLSYFQNNWFMFRDPEIIEYLGVQRFYEHSLGMDNFDDLFTKSPDEIKDIIAGIPAGQRTTVAYKARQMIANGEIDSLKVIGALENALGIELIEH